MRSDRLGLFLPCFDLDGESLLAPFVWEGDWSVVAAVEAEVSPFGSFWWRSPM